MPFRLSRRTNVMIPCGISGTTGDGPGHVHRGDARGGQLRRAHHGPARAGSAVAAVVASWSYPLIPGVLPSWLPPGRGARSCSSRGRDPRCPVHPGRGVRGGGLPAGCLQHVTGTGQVAESWRRTGRGHRGVAGPTSAGRADRRDLRRDPQAGEPRLGGKSAAIMLDDVDLSATAAELGACASPTPGRTWLHMSRCWARGAGTTRRFGPGLRGSRFVVVTRWRGNHDGALASPRQRSGSSRRSRPRPGSGARIVPAGGGRRAVPALLRAHRVRRRDAEMASPGTRSTGPVVT